MEVFDVVALLVAGVPSLICHTLWIASSCFQLGRGETSPGTGRLLEDGLLIKDRF